MLRNAWLCFSISSSFVGNNPSLQIHSFSEDRGKCNKTSDPSMSDFSTILTSHILILADSSYLSSGEAYQQRLSLPCYRLSTPCYECKPNARHFSREKKSLKRDSAGIFGWLEIMIQHKQSIICNFHFPVDFRLDILYPQIFWFLHQNWVGIGWFTLTKLRHVGDEAKTIPSCLDNRSRPTMAPPVLLQSAFCALKKTDCKKNRLAEVRSFQVYDLDILSARRVSPELQLEKQS